MIFPIAAVLCSSDIKNEDLAHAFKSVLKLVFLRFTYFLGLLHRRVYRWKPSQCL